VLRCLLKSPKNFVVIHVYSVLAALPTVTLNFSWFVQFSFRLLMSWSIGSGGVNRESYCARVWVLFLRANAYNMRGIPATFYTHGLGLSTETGSRKTQKR